MSVPDRLPDDWCPHCGQKLNGWTPVEDSDAEPKPGDAAICVYCHCLNIYALDLTLRRPTNEDLAYYARDGGHVRILAAVNASWNWHG